MSLVLATGAGALIMLFCYVFGTWLASRASGKFGAFTAGWIAALIAASAWQLLIHWSA